MNEIVCATRGGEASRAVQMAAIETAKSTGYPLVFLYVVATQSFRNIEHGLEEAILEELAWLGQAVLNVAQDRASGEGIPSKTVIRMGNVRDEICDFLRERQASLLLLGAPRSATTSIFGDDPVEQFARAIHESTAVDVAVVRPDRTDSDSYYSYLVPA